MPSATTTKTNTRVLFNERPTGYPEPGKTLVLDKSESIDHDNVPINGGLLVKLIVISVDPYLRGLMNKQSSYLTGFQIGEPIYALGVSKVLRSEHPDYTTGDHIYGVFKFKEYDVLSGEALDTITKIENRENLPWSTFIGVCGMPGMTAYSGYHEFFTPYLKKGDIIFITTGGGPVGSFLIHLAKADGLKVIASAGSEEKVKFMKECGADVAFNYKTTSTKQILDEHGPINFYWDNVGGESLDLALDAAAPNSHFVECGLISGYNGNVHPLKNYAHILWKQITVSGFLVMAYQAKYLQKFMSEIPARVAKGEIKYTEDKRYGLESVGQTMYDVQAGSNTGKAVIVVSKD